MKYLCPYCNNSISFDSIFCIHCGRDLRKAKEPIQKTIEVKPIQRVEEESEPELVSAKGFSFTTLFNGIVLLVAIACIAAFFYSRIDNAKTTTADKSATNEEIIDNLYRNKKYKFRIKYPKGWEIKKGDGPNILTKAVNENGSNVNVYVKDLGVNYGSIDDLFTLDEWSESVHEKFPSAKVIEKQDTFIDNQKAFFIKYSIKYETLDQKADMIGLSVALIHDNFLYAVTGSSKYRLFAEDEPLLKESISTFVVEDY